MSGKLARPISPNVGSRSPGAPHEGGERNPEAIAVVGTIPLVILEITSDFCGFVIVVTGRVRCVWHKSDPQVRALGIPQGSSIDPEVIRNANCLIRDGIYRCADRS